MSLPFSAARARNAGFERLSRIDPEVRFVQFLDGDCEVADGWLERGRRALEERPEAAVVFGRRRERFPERSIYNRLADIEWNMPIAREGGRGSRGVRRRRDDPGRGLPGRRRFQSLDSGGRGARALPAAPRRGVLGGPARCRHDLARLGDAAVPPVGAAAVPDRLRRPRLRDPVRPRRRRSVPPPDPQRPGLGARLAAGPDRCGSLAALPSLAGPVAGGLAAGLVVLALPAQVVRIAARNRTQAGSLGAALAYGVLTMVGKFSQLAGQCLYLRDRLAGRHARLIEYKFAAPVTKQAAP